MHTPEKSELVELNDESLREFILVRGGGADDLPPMALIPTNCTEMEETLMWCINKPSGLSKQVSCVVSISGYMEDGQVRLMYTTYS